MSMQEVRNLPAEWLAAFERDRLGVTVSNDPLPERRASRVLAAFILSGLLFLAFPGTLIGVFNLLSIAEQRTSTAANVAWIQAHGQAQVFGWVGAFILGISLYFLPKFLGRTIARFGWAWLVWGLWTAGTAWRWWIGVSGGRWRVGLVSSAAMELAAFAVSQYLLWFAGKRPRQATPAAGAQRGFVFWLVLTGFVAFGMTLVVNLVISVQVARAAALPVYPPVGDRMLLTLALWGFAVPVAWGYSSRFVSVFLGLREPVRRLAPYLGAGVAATIVLVLAGEFRLAGFLALALSIGAIWALRIFQPPARTVKRIGVYRHYDAFVRLSFAWLLIGAILGALADALPQRSGLGGASRHAVTVGFLATLIFSIGPRILPSFLNGRELWSPRLMAATLWLVSLGCLLRVSSESLAYSSTGAAWGAAWSVLPASAFLELGAVLIFVANIGMTLAQKIPAWFSPAGVNANNLVYFYVASFPKSKSVLVQAGLKTLGGVREVPRSLTLQEAAEADGANVEKLLAALREFFADRQPRRAGREPSDESRREPK